MRFRVLRSMGVLQFDCQIGRGNSFEAAKLGCMAYDNRGIPLKFAPNVQELTKEEDSLRTFRVYFLFDQALSTDSPHQPYAVQYEYEGENPYPELGKSREASFLIRGQGDADELILAVALPRLDSPFQIREVADLSWEELATVDFHRSHGELCRSEELSVLDLESALRLDHEIERYQLVGRRARDVRQGQAIGFLID